jgi:tetratricopeptide (TPR) repeat protein
MMQRLVLIAIVCLGAACGGSQKQVRLKGDPLRQVSAKSLYRTGAAFADQGDYVRAEQYLVAALAKGYSEDKVLPVLLRACLESSRLRAGISYAEPYLSRHPEDWRLRFVLATVYASLGETSRARSELHRVLETSPNFGGAHFALGKLSLEELDLTGAKKHFKRYLVLEPHGIHAAEAKEAMSRQAPKSVASRVKKRGRR